MLTATQQTSEQIEQDVEDTGSFNAAKFFENADLVTVGTTTYRIEMVGDGDSFVAVSTKQGSRMSLDHLFEYYQEHRSVSKIIRYGEG